MIFPGTVNGIVNGLGGGLPGSQDDRKKLLKKLTDQRLQAAPLFGGQGRQATDLPQAALPSVTFNPFLAMLSQNPHETFKNLPANLQGDPNAGNNFQDPNAGLTLPPNLQTSSFQPNGSPTASAGAPPSVGNPQPVGNPIGNNTTATTAPVRHLISENDTQAGYGTPQPIPAEHSSIPGYGTPVSPAAQLVQAILANARMSAGRGALLQG